MLVRPECVRALQGGISPATKARQSAPLDGTGMSAQAPLSPLHAAGIGDRENGDMPDGSPQGVLEVGLGLVSVGRQERYEGVAALMQLQRQQQQQQLRRMQLRHSTETPGGACDNTDSELDDDESKMERENEVNVASLPGSATGSPGAEGSVPAVSGALDGGRLRLL